MTLLVALGIGSLIFVAGFTAVQYSRAPGLGQSPKSAIIEAWLNIVIGFSINFLANFAILPLVDAHITPAQNFWMGWIYTAVSIVRQFVIRRWFNDRLHRVAQKLS